MTRFGQAPRAAAVTRLYDEAYRQGANWELGRPQAALRWVIDRGLVRSPALDLGCGTGELSIYLAARGYDVLGIDLSGVAVREARARARGRGVDATFLQADALAVDDLAGAGVTFRTVLDSATYHTLDDWERSRLARALGRVVAPGGLFVVLGDRPRAAADGYGLTPEGLYDRFCAGGEWRPLFAYETVVQRRPGDTAAWLVGLERA